MRLFCQYSDSTARARGSITMTPILSFTRPKRVGHGQDVFRQVAGWKAEVLEESFQEIHRLRERGGQRGESAVRSWRSIWITWEPKRTHITRKSGFGPLFRSSRQIR